MFAESKNTVILIAEDNADDAVLLRRALKKAGIESTVHVSENGEDAIAYLCGTERYTDRTTFPFPSMLITDLKMPRCDGFELLARVQTDGACAVYPKIVLSGSRADKDVDRVFALGANCYFCKPGTFDELVSVMQLLKEFWSRSILPRRAPPLPEV